jgi:hypothetical protein
VRSHRLARAGFEGVLNVWARPVGTDAPKTVTNEPSRPIYWYEWSTASAGRAELSAKVEGATAEVR